MPACGQSMNVDKKEVKTLNEEIETGKETRNMVMVGKPAPLFKASAYHNGEFKEVKLEDYKGKWVLLCFYPGDFTFVWATEVSAVAAQNDKFEELDVQVLSVSVDSEFVHKVWNDVELNKIAKKDVPFPMLADSSGAIGELYGVYDRDAGVNVRGRFIIDPDGIIQAMEVLTPPVGRNVSESLRQIQAYQMVRETKGAEVAPSGWTPGGKTLKPGIGLVGKVWEQWTVEDAYKENK